MAHSCSIKQASIRTPGCHQLLDILPSVTGTWRVLCRGLVGDGSLAVSARILLPKIRPGPSTSPLRFANQISCWPERLGHLTCENDPNYLGRRLRRTDSLMYQASLKISASSPLEFKASSLAAPCCYLTHTPFLSKIPSRRSRHKLSLRQPIRQTSLQGQLAMNGGSSGTAFPFQKGQNLSTVLLAHLTHADGPELYRMLMSLQVRSDVQAQQACTQRGEF